MSLTQWVISNIPSFAVCLIMMAAAVALSVGGTLLVHRFIPHHKLKSHNDITGPIFGALGAIYAVLLAFMVVVTWQKFDRARLNAEMEANCLINLYTDAEPFDGAFKEKVYHGIGDYARKIIEEWDSLTNEADAAGGNKTLAGISKLYCGYSPGSETQKVYFEESVDKVNELINLRISRLIDARTGIDPLLWFVLIVGGVITITFTIFFGSESLKPKILMSTLLAMVIALVLFTILEFSFPFSGSVNIAPEPFKELIARLKL